MEKIIVNASKKYEILIKEDLLDEVGAHIKEICSPSKILLVSDTNVFPLYGNRVISSLENVGFEVIYYVITAGEGSKNSESLFELIDVLADNEFSRKDVLVSLGGGVVGDLVGFCASIYLRGLKFFQIPTTLLAAVDSSVGGKTAIDISQGKNLVGSFYQPSGVFFDPKTLDTLSAEIYSDGMAEVIKYGVIIDEKLFSELEKCDGRIGIEQIKRCIEIKRDIVEKDEFESGIRKLLNFGHTFGHAIEKVSGYSVSHGRAVAMGMRMIAKACFELGRCKEKDYLNLVSLLEKYSLGIKIDFNREALSDAILFDKKREGDELSLVTFEGIGRCVVEKVSISDAVKTLYLGS